MILLYDDGIKWWEIIVIFAEETKLNTQTWSKNIRDIKYSMDMHCGFFGTKGCKHLFKRRVDKYWNIHLRSSLRGRINKRKSTRATLLILSFLEPLDSFIFRENRFLCSNMLELYLLLINCTSKVSM